MLFIFSAEPWIALAEQRSVPVGNVVLWDYHVVTLTRWAVPAPDTIAYIHGPDPTLRAASSVQRSRNRTTGPWRVVDPDSRTAFGVLLERYLVVTFRPGVRNRVLFRLMPWESARTAFGSDRRHMKRGDGTWIQPPPPWPAINPQHHILDACLATTENRYGPALSWEELTALALSPATVGAPDSSETPGPSDAYHEPDGARTNHQRFFTSSANPGTASRNTSDPSSRTNRPENHPNT